MTNNLSSLDMRIFDTVISLNICNPFTSVPTQEVVQFLKNKLNSMNYHLGKCNELI